MNLEFPNIFLTMLNAAQRPQGTEGGFYQQVGTQSTDYS